MSAAGREASDSAEGLRDPSRPAGHRGRTVVVTVGAPASSASGASGASVIGTPVRSPGRWALAARS